MLKMGWFGVVRGHSRSLKIAPITEICKALQSVENVVDWGGCGSPKVIENSAIRFMHVCFVR